MLRSLLIPLCLVVSLAACQRDPATTPTVIETQEVASPEEGGAVSTAPVQPAPAPPQAAPAPVPAAPDWSPLELAADRAWLGCTLDYVDGDGEPLTDLGRESLQSALAPCVAADVVRLRYRGKINSDLVALVERVTRTADALGIDSRVLDIDSAGGQVEDAIRVGDWIGGSHWTIWIREDSVCHSACVFVLGAGDVRVVGGRVGIHRIIRLSSTATTRAQLNAELTAVYGRVREYLERNGVSTVLADLMKSVPNRSLRLLTHDELRQYGLDGVNPAQDDLDRVRLLAKCGDDFMRRRDAYVRAFDDRCRAPGREVAALNTCGLELRGSFGFPDETCPIESPLSEFNALAAAGKDTGDDAADAGADAATGASGSGGDRSLAQDRARTPRPDDGG